MKAARKDSLRWKRKVEINFDRIIALIESGVAAKFAVQQVEDGPKYFHLVRWLNEVRPDLWPLYQAAVAKSQSSVVPFTEEAFDRALEMIADIPHGLFNAWHVDGLPGVKTMRARARRDRSFKARFDEALAQRRVHVRPHTYDDKDYSAALDVIEGLEQGQPLRDADDILETLNLPGTGAIFKRVQRDRALADRMRQINEARGRRRYSEADYLAAVEVVASHPEEFPSHVLERFPELPAYGTLRVYHRDRPEFRPLLLSALAKRRVLRKEARTRRVYAEHQLYNSLHQNELYKAAERLFHHGMPDRDDMIAEVVIAVLDGRLAAEDIASAGRAIAYKSRSKDGYLFSLEEPGSRHQPAAIDVITADQWSFEDAA